nr:reverse transcriptase domain-containing protein [Tanacetum cinerariifolium]
MSRHTRASYVGMILIMVMIVRHGSRLSMSRNRATVRTLDTEDSLIMGYEDLHTIPKKESDEFIRSSVEDLIPIPSESEDTSDSECDLPFRGNFMIFSNPLFDLNDNFTSSVDESLSDEDVPEDKAKIYSNPLFEFDDEYISITPLSDANEDEWFDPGDDIDEIEHLLHRDPSTPKMSVRIVLKCAKITKNRTISTQDQKPQRKARSGSKFSANNLTMKLNLSKVQVYGLFLPKDQSQSHQKLKVKVQGPNMKSTSLVESEIQTNAMMADNRTMAQMLPAPIEGYENAIVVPPINANNFKLKQTLINLVQSNQFTGRQDPHNHLRFFNKFTSTFRHPEVPNTTVKLLLFPFSLEGEA